MDARECTRPPLPAYGVHPVKDTRANGPARLRDHGRMDTRPALTRAPRLLLSTHGPGHSDVPQSSYPRTRRHPTSITRPAPPARPATSWTPTTRPNTPGLKRPHGLDAGRAGHTRLNTPGHGPVQPARVAQLLPFFLASHWLKIKLAKDLLVIFILCF